MTTMEELVRLVPPPTEPVDARGDWREVEGVLGLGLPGDFKALVELYGVGQFVSFVTPFPPFGAHPLLIQRAQGLLDRERYMREKEPDEYPYPLYPEPGGLLEWGGTDNGDSLCWLTTGEPDNWRVVVWNPRSNAYDAHDVGAVEFLHGWLSGRITSPRLPDEVEASPWFEPFREREHVYIELSEGELPYHQRLRILRDALAPTADRGSSSDEDGDRQDHFAATDLDWLLTYETVYGHQIRVAFPPEDEEQVRVTLFDAARHMGCQVLSTTTRLGEPVWI
ncbi:SMI1-KNR4 cell-wall [Sinosporangium album]|uniref:SMI1-KNR4 cell-wall n=1 Tax=Sinosporangium album TaxID=504805 RepID=A0A1G8JV44_9ACTN|nr:SMI1/KNR4 family protein [Sinosporangium album]SDI35011.1 SMI1-KNR4 cell-wall [Sinosporangium album]